MDSTEWTQSFQKAVLAWFGQNGRDFPWRNTNKPFHVLLAEILLRQTQAKRVVNPYLDLIQCYPDPRTLANADVNALRLWFKPLGLVKRADLLVEAAQILLKEHGGDVPRDLESLLKLPGVGRYIAGATLCLSFGEPFPMVDEASGRVLRRVLSMNSEGPAYTDTKLLQTAETLLPHPMVKEFNLGLIDIAAAHCYPRKPNCFTCPLFSLCSFGRNRVREKMKKVDGSYI